MARCSSGLARLPTIDEQGIKGFEVTSWTGVFVPAGTPPAAIAAIREAIFRASSDPSILELAKTTGLETVVNSPIEFASFLHPELKKSKKAVVAGNVQVE